MKVVFSFLFLFFSFFSSTIYSQSFVVPEKPKFIPPVIDSIGLLNKIEYNSLYNKLVKYSDSTSTEIVIAIIGSTKGESIGVLTPRWGHKWGIGQAKEDNGVFILLAKNDRKIWISPGYGVEHKLTAGIVGELTRNIILPEFKRNNYYAGLDRGTDVIFKILSGEYKATEKPGDSGDISGIVIFIIIIIIFFILVSKGNKNNRGGGRRYRTDSRDIFDTIILSNSGRGGFGGGSFGGSSSSGGFGGFGGGGGFSGGGAGGSW